MTAVAHVLGTPGTGGVPVVAHALLRRLRSERRFLYYLTDRTADRPRWEAAVAGLEASGVVVRAVPADVAADKGAAVTQLAGWLAEDGVQLVHTHSTRPNRYGRIAALQAGTAVVAHYHNFYDDRWGEGSEALELERRLARRTDHVVACSERVRDHVVDRLRLDPARVTVVGNGVDADRFADGDRSVVRAELGVADGTVVVGAVGRLCAQKAPDDLLEAAVPVLRRTDRRVELWFVGAPDDAVLAQSLAARALALGVADRVRFLGYRADVADVYAALDVVVLPSRWEGFGLVVAEAMAAGRPVVATEVGGVAEAAGGAALLVPPGDVAGLTRTIRRLVDDEELAAYLVARGRLRVAALGWDGAAETLDRVYRRVLAQTPARSGHAVLG